MVKTFVESITPVAVCACGALRRSKNPTVLKIILKLYIQIEGIDVECPAQKHLVQTLILSIFFADYNVVPRTQRCLVRKQRVLVTS